MLISTKNSPIKNKNQVYGEAHIIEVIGPDFFEGVKAQM